MKNLVDVKWLKQNINDENLVIIDCRFDLKDKEYGKRSFEKSHIKGAFRLDIETQLTKEISTHGGRHPLPSPNELKEVFENIGINNNSRVVIYDDGDLSGAARVWCILKYLGHKNVFVLNGGIKEFIKIDGEVSKEDSIPKKGDFDIDINRDMNVDINYVKNILKDENVLLVDSREYVRYIGEFEPVDFKKGHIPGAKNYFWQDVLDINEEFIKLKDCEILKKHFEKLNNYKEIIIYCGSGITASVNSIALDEIGINHKIYQGSFSDWITYEENEVSTI